MIISYSTNIPYSAILLIINILGGPGDTIAYEAHAKILTTPTFRSNHAHFGIIKAFVPRRQGVLGCRTSSKSA